mmetsp:Transcript_30998/g.72323  ORF Transcript_30998/g.72323 Transcript_30998/m.72323 type:complete len:368 (+) Transcript_30998:103-1206(+)
MGEAEEKDHVSEASLDTEAEFGGIDWDEMDINWQNEEPEEEDSSVHNWRFELEVIPDSAAADMEGLFSQLRQLEVPGAKFLGWRSAPFFFGAKKMIAIVTLDSSLHENKDQGRNAIVNATSLVETVESCSALGELKEYIGDPFAVSSRLFRLSTSAVADLALKRVNVAQVQRLMQSGYVVIDNWLPPEKAAGISELVQSSLATFPDFQNDGIEWHFKEPRSARADIATDLIDGQRPATDSVFAEHVLPAYYELEEDLKQIISVKGNRQQQLAWYQGNGLGYSAHFDAWPVDDPESDIRKVTAIMYCNKDWEPSHGGALKIWLLDHEGADEIEIEPLAGRLLIFLSGCIRHEVSPAHSPRVAFTTWLR